MATMSDARTQRRHDPSRIHAAGPRARRARVGNRCAWALTKGVAGGSILLPAIVESALLQSRLLQNRLEVGILAQRLQRWIDLQPDDRLRSIGEALLEVVHGVGVVAEACFDAG